MRQESARQRWRQATREKNRDGWGRSWPALLPAQPTVPDLSKLGDFDLELAEAVDEVRPHPLHVAGDMHPHAPRVHLFKQHPQLELSEARTDAAVDAVPERQVPPGVLARDVELVRV